jgi:hypothetical protein
VVGVVVLVAIALLALPLWWVLDSYVFTDATDPTVVATNQPTSSTEEGSNPVNLALRKPVTGTGPGSDPEPPGRVVDGNPDTAWNSGGYAPQVVQIDLEESSTIHSIRLLTGQSPAGDTEHIIFGWPLGEPEAEILHVFEGYTTDRQWLVYTPDAPWEGIDRIGVGTAASPSWVAWFEIEVIGTTP